MENKRFALDIGVTLSSQIINACLSMLAIIGATFIFVIDKRETSIIFYILISLGFLSFIYSIIIGGKGIDIIRKKSFTNVLELDSSKTYFNQQAIFCLLGLFLCLISLFFTDKNVNENKDLKEINQNINELINLKKENSKNTDSLFKEINSLKLRFDRLESQQIEYEKASTQPMCSPKKR